MLAAVYVDAKSAIGKQMRAVMMLAQCGCGGTVADGRQRAFSMSVVAL